MLFLVTLSTMPSIHELREVACPLAAFGGSMRPWYNIAHKSAHFLPAILMSLSYPRRTGLSLILQMEGVVSLPSTKADN